MKQAVIQRCPIKRGKVYYLRPVDRPSPLTVLYQSPPRPRSRSWLVITAYLGAVLVGAAIALGWI